jgi:photosystem II stability/assembly factor-like uncharacterized protein
MLVAWSHADHIWLAIQHRIVHLQQDVSAQVWTASQHFFSAGEQVTALYIAPNQEGIWVATTSAVYHTPDSGASWTQKAKLPTSQPAVFLRALPACLEVITLGGEVWRAYPDS